MDTPDSGFKSLKYNHFYSTFDNYYGKLSQEQKTKYQEKFENMKIKLGETKKAGDDPIYIKGDAVHELNQNLQATTVTDTSIETILNSLSNHLAEGLTLEKQVELQKAEEQEMKEMREAEERRRQASKHRQPQYGDRDNWQQYPPQGQRGSTYGASSEPGSYDKPYPSRPASSYDSERHSGYDGGSSSRGSYADSDRTGTRYGNDSRPGSSAHSQHSDRESYDDLEPRRDSKASADNLASRVLKSMQEAMGSKAKVRNAKNELIALRNTLSREFREYLSQGMGDLGELSAAVNVFTDDFLEEMKEDDVSAKDVMAINTFLSSNASTDITEKLHTLGTQFDKSDMIHFLGEDDEIDIYEDDSYKFLHDKTDNELQKAEKDMISDLLHSKVERALEEANVIKESLEKSRDVQDERFKAANEKRIKISDELEDSMSRFNLVMMSVATIGIGFVIWAIHLKIKESELNHITNDIKKIRDRRSQKDKEVYTSIRDTMKSAKMDQKAIMKETIKLDPEDKVKSSTASGKKPSFFSRSRKPSIQSML
ncbi:hypothetical protein N9A04_00245 [Rickettsiales bacterium]|nr:hypothetical protein [Rickettsiales bacterium]